VASRLIMLLKSDLSADQHRLVQARLSASEHEHDTGPIRVWKVYEQGLYAFVRVADGAFIGLAESSGLPLTTAGWWIDTEFRGMGYGNELVDLLAARRKSEGAEEVINSPIDSHLGQYDAASRRLMDRFREHLRPHSQ